VRILTLGFIAAVLGVLFAGEPACAQGRAAGSQQAAVHNPFLPNHQPLLQNQPIGGLGGTTIVRRRLGATYLFSYWPYLYGGYYGYDPYSYWGYPYYYNPYYYGYYGAYGLPPVAFPAGTNQTNQPRAARVPRAAAADRPKVRQTNAETKDLAGKSIDIGDAHFAKQKFQAALERYRKAAQTAPDLAESYFLQGHALVAVSQYPAAGKAFRKGLDIGPDWVESGFRLDRLYGDNRVAKASHFEALALAAEKNPHDANLLFVLGVELFFDGQADRSRKFFERSAALGGNRDHLLDTFLFAPPPAGKRAEQAGRVEF
jgi:tetratricopeptide (TPR) repeat protein